MLLLDKCYQFLSYQQVPSTPETQNFHHANNLFINNISAVQATLSDVINYKEYNIIHILYIYGNITILIH